jgi:hypothetical protein
MNVCAPSRKSGLLCTGMESDGLIFDRPAVVLQGLRLLLRPISVTDPVYSVSPAREQLRLADVVELIGALPD